MAEPRQLDILILPSSMSIPCTSLEATMEATSLTSTSLTLPAAVGMPFPQLDSDHVLDTERQLLSTKNG